MGAVAVGIPAATNAFLARRSERLATPDWGRHRKHPWTYGEISYQHLGQGPSLTMIHSFGPGHDSEEWRPVAELLSGDCTIFAPDLLGWGRSDKPDIPYDDRLYIQLLTDFLEDVVDRRSAVVAAGAAAAYALRVAIERPDLISALALLGPAGIGNWDSESPIQDALIHQLLRLPVLGTSALNLLTTRSALGQYLRREVFWRKEQADAARVEHLYRSSHQPGSHGPLAAFLDGDLDHSIEEVLPSLEAPLWLGWGRHATEPPVETADLWLQLCPRATLEVFEESSNLPQMEQSSAVSAWLRGFLGSACG